jgi:hypothetical protein
MKNRKTTKRQTNAVKTGAETSFNGVKIIVLTFVKNSLISKANCPVQGKNIVLPVKNRGYNRNDDRQCNNSFNSAFDNRATGRFRIAEKS